MPSDSGGTGSQPRSSRPLSLEDATALQDGLVAVATGGDFPGGAEAYAKLRQKSLAPGGTLTLVPKFVRECRSLMQFWAFIKHEHSTYADRRDFLWNAFSGLLLHLEAADTQGGPALEVSDTLAVFDVEHVQAVWVKALDRRQSDPDGAITAARALLETVLKHILDSEGVDPGDRADLPKLWRLVAERLDLAPEHHQEEVFKSILGGCQTIVNQIATIRNRLGDAHGKGPRRVRPTPRHAALVVNLAGAMSAFVTETWLERPRQQRSEV